MVGDQLGVTQRHLRESRLENVGEGCVQLFAPLSEQGAVDRFAQQPVAKGVLAAPIALDEPGAQQTLEGIEQLAALAAAERLEQLQRELASDHRRHLRGLSCLAQRVQAREQRVAQAVGDLGGRTRLAVAGGACRETARHRRGELLEKERHAVRLDDELCQRVLVRPGAAEQPPRELAGLRFVERLEAELDRMRRGGGPRRLESRAIGDDEHDAVLGDRLERSRDQLERARVRPVRVLEDDDRRQGLGEPDGLLLERSHRLLATLLGAHLRAAIAVRVERDGEQLGDERHDLVLAGLGAELEPLLEPGEPRIR